jgi:Putative porin
MRQFIMRALHVCAFAIVFVIAAHAQTPAPQPNTNAPAATSLDEVRRQLQEQSEEIERLRTTVKEQSQLLQQLLTREHAAAPPATVESATYNTNDVATTDVLDSGSGSTTNASARATASAQPKTSAQTPTASAPKPSEITTGTLSSISFSGDFRLRYEGLFGQLNALPNSADPSIVGNELSSRNRTRIRARLAIRGQFGREVAKGEREFQWGLRLATGTFGDLNSTNQTATDFFTRKAFAVDQAYITYKPARVPGLRLQAGKFETPWLATELTIDVDLMPEGLNELYARDFKHSRLKNLTFIAWQLPFLERNSAFVLGSDGHVSVDQSRRAGRDLALYGAQLRGRLALTPHAGLTLSAADLYYSGTQFINIAQFTGTQLQIPITFTIPASGTTPAQTITTVVNIPRDALVTGSGIGTSVANTNAVNRDGHLSSGFNLVDLIGRLDLNASQHYPLALIFDYVHNTQAHDVVVAGTGGANRLLPNHEDNGVWAEVRVCRLHEAKTCDSLDRLNNAKPGDMLFGYTFIRIEKDAVLTPFNFSDLLQPSDIRAHRLTFTYAVDPRVLLTLTDVISERPNGLLGIFGATPVGSLNQATHRFQFDTVFRF